MNDLLKYFNSGVGRPIHKLSNYFDAYERHFARFRGKSPVILEIGVSNGGSIQMWRDYFGPGAQLFGMDIDSKCLVMEEEGFKIFIGDQGDPEFLKKVRSEIPPIDVLIDDGSHSNAHQRLAFDILYDHVKPNGIFFVEDTHSSYRRANRGAHRRPSTFVELAKDLVDEVHSFWSQDKTLPITQFTRTCSSVHFYDSIVVFEKELREAPYNVFGGEHPERFKPRRARVPLEEMPPLDSLPRSGASARRRPWKAEIETETAAKP